MNSRKKSTRSMSRTYYRVDFLSIPYDCTELLIPKLDFFFWTMFIFERQMLTNIVWEFEPMQTHKMSVSIPW